MTQPIFKQARGQDIPAPQQQSSVSGEQSFQYNGVPVDIYRLFDADMSSTSDKDSQKLKYIYDWAKEKCGEERSMGNIMQKISSLKNQLGVPTNGQKVYDKVWHWVKLQNIINDLQKRQESMRPSWQV